MQKVKVTNFDTLEQEINRLNRRKRQLEHELAGRVDYFKDNYKKMALNAVIPGAGKHSSVLGVAGKVAQFAWESGKFKSFATGALMTALEFVGVRLGINLFDQFSKRRKKKKAEKEAKLNDED
ncbi:hypothetical protein KTO58_23685 [Chitinophaga pendula]|uniref:hypothetical protein n=1 Tax=Chitinophaga TaxID=79328 RepID=UPI000BAFDDBC|nr:MULTISPECIES: hypothetical protein [Chitinophaga]ASZ10399.1 hypothetical protein CK934_05080 [Chitinophaga sp. MD30]UCJ06636.1 hypothetical protein KTO58_23685 [Chitinophaga pendula]